MNALERKLYRIYLIEDMMDGKNYVGYTSCKYFKQRIQVTKHEAFKKKPNGEWLYSTPIYEAYRRNGDHFRWTILYEGVMNRIEAGEIEDYYIKLYNTLYPHGYNCEEGGDNGKRVEAYRDSLNYERNSKAMKKWWSGMSDEEREQHINKLRKGHRKMSPEAKAKRGRKISEALKKLNADPDRYNKRVKKFRQTMAKKREALEQSESK